MQPRSAVVAVVAVATVGSSQPQIWKAFKAFLQALRNSYVDH